MRIDRLTRSLWFAAAAAVGLVFTAALLTPVVGGSNARVLYWVVCAMAYAGMLASRPREAVGKVAFVAAWSAAVVLLAGHVEPMAGMRGTAFVALGLTIGLAVVRSGFGQSAARRRIWAVEFAIGTAALAFSAFLWSPGWLGHAVALWGYGLVQSVFFLVPGRGMRGSRPGAPAGDPFDRARERLDALLEQA